MLTLEKDEDVTAFAAGQVIIITERHRWWVRLWRWLMRRVLRRKPPALTVTAVDPKTGTITFGCNLTGGD